MILTKTVIWFQIFWSVAPTIWKLNAREEGITKIKNKENYFKGKKIFCNKKLWRLWYYFLGATL